VQASNLNVSEQLAASQAMYAAVFDHSPVPICIYALSDFHIMDVNDAALRLYGYRKDELIGRDVRQLLHPNEVTRFERAPCRFREGFQKGPIWRHVTKDRREIHVRVSTELMEFEGTKAQLALAQDVTDYRAAARRARDAERKLRAALTQTIQVLLSASEQRDAYTAGHQQRVCGVTVAIAEQMGLSFEQIQGLRFGSMVHDIGKLGIPGELLSLPRTLKPEEYALVKMHSQIGYDILSDMDYPWPIQDLVLQHHERLDGSGYPNQLRGSEICLEARVLAVADAVEAMSSHRPYRPSLGLERALDEVSAEAGPRYDADVVDACRALHKRGKLEPLLAR
jgi:PAS domain S-box-containing protein